MKTIVSFALFMIPGSVGTLAFLGSAFWVSQNVPGWILALLALAMLGLSGFSDWYNPRNRASINVASFLAFMWAAIAFCLVGNLLGLAIIMGIGLACYVGLLAWVCIQSMMCQHHPATA